MRGRAPGSPLAWLGGLLALYLAVPVVAFLVRVATSDDRGFGGEGLADALRISVVTASISTALIAVCGIPLAHWLARSRSRVAGVVGVLVQLPLALPPVMSGIVLIYLVGPYTWIGRQFDGRLTDSMTGIVLAQAFVSAPFLVIAARTSFAAVDPALEDLAATLGHHSLARFWRVALPIAQPGIRAGLLLTWLRALGEYGATVLLAYNPHSLPVFTYVQFSALGVPPTQAPTALALALAAVAVVVSRLRLPRRWHRTPALPVPVAPPAAGPVPVRLDLDLAVGSFRLRLAHAATSHRVAVLGPSGAGKSITLRALAGLLGERAGSVWFGADAVAGVPVERRRLGYVPQGGPLLPDRTVRQQLLFGVDADPARAAWWLRTLRLDGLEDRRPDQLSGGQRQRVALAQALSRDPRLLLLDEPFTGLDAPVRDELRRELRRLQHEAGLSTVLVTHDPEEAALLADEILVIGEGRLLQAGGRAEVFGRPASPEVARLLGISNLGEGRVLSADEIGGAGLRLVTGEHGLPMGSRVLWTVRPDHVRLRADIDVRPDGDIRGHRATVLDVADLGTLTLVSVRLADGTELQVRTTGAPVLDLGDACAVEVAAEDVVTWPAQASYDVAPGEPAPARSGR